MAKRKRKTTKAPAATTETKSSLREVAKAFVESVGKDVGPSETFAKFKVEHPDLNGNTESSVKAAINNARSVLGFSKPRGGGTTTRKDSKKRTAAQTLADRGINGKPTLAQVAGAIAVLTAAGLVVE